MPEAANYTIRPVLPGDEPGMEALLTGLDPDSRYRRWFSYVVDVHRASRWAAHPEVEAALGLVAVHDEEIVGHGVMIPITDARAEVAFEVAAPWRRHGIAGALLDGLVAGAVANGTSEVCAEVLSSNADMLAVFREHGLLVERSSGGVVSVTLPVAG